MNSKKGIFYAILAATLYAINAPLSKLVLGVAPPVIMAGLLYLGAGVGMCIPAVLKRLAEKPAFTNTLGRDDLKYTLYMILLDVAAPICLLIGLKHTTAESASLLNNFEIVATALIAMSVFGEKISRRLWLGIVCVTASCILLSVDSTSGLGLSVGALFILLACVCWGVENNCTRKLSEKDPLQIVIIKGIFSGSTSLAIGLIYGERLADLYMILAILAIGFVAYGMSIFFYVHAQRLAGAARTSAYYAIAPFIGVILSIAIFREMPKYTFFIALAVMCVGAWLSSSDKPLLKRKRK